MASERSSDTSGVEAATLLLMALPRTGLDRLDLRCLALGPSLCLHDLCLHVDHTRILQGAASPLL